MNNRLATKLILAMLLTALLSDVIILTSQEIGRTLYLRSLPVELQETILQNRDGNLGVFEGVFRRDAESPNSFSNLQIVHRRSSIVGTCIAGLVVSLVALWLARRISKPIEDVSSSSLSVAQGDLSTRVEASSYLQPYVSREVRELAKNFNQMATSLEMYEEERTAMIASIAHDLRTPLTAIQVRLEALQENLVPFNQDEVTRLLVQTELLHRLISDLRVLSLADAQKLSLNKQSFSLTDLLVGIINGYELKAAEKQIELTFLPFSKEVFIHADPQRITQVLDNLLINALGATPTAGKIVVSLSEVENNALIVVKDSGKGIPENLLPVIFDRFIQGKDKTGSSGLGLAIVKTLVTLHGGTIEASNCSDCGAQFELRLPLKAS